MDFLSLIIQRTVDRDFQISRLIFKNTRLFFQISRVFCERSIEFYQNNQSVCYAIVTNRILNKQY